MFRNIQGQPGKNLERMSVLQCDGKTRQPGLRRMFRVWLAFVSLSPAQRLRQFRFPNNPEAVKTTFDAARRAIFSLCRAFVPHPALTKRKK